MAGFIDRALGGFAADQRPPFDAGLAELETERSHCFEAVRAATTSGVLANPEYGGNAGTVGRRAIGRDDRFVSAEPFGWYDGMGAAGE